MPGRGPRNPDQRYVVWWESKGNWVVIDTTKPDKRSLSGWFVVRRFRNRQDAQSFYLQIDEGEI